MLEAREVIEMKKQIFTLMVCAVVFALPPAYGMENDPKYTSHSIGVSQTTPNSSVTSMRAEKESKETTPESFYTLAESFYFITPARENRLAEYGHPTTLTNNFEEDSSSDSPFKNQFNNDNQDSFEGLQPNFRTMLSAHITEDRFLNLLELFNNGQRVLLNTLCYPDHYYIHIFQLTLLACQSFETASKWRPIHTPQNLSPVVYAPQSMKDDLSEDGLFLDSEMNQVD